MKDVLASYRPGVAFDEMIDEAGEVRPSYQAVHRSLQRATPAELKLIAEFLAHNYFQAGVTFDVGGVERRTSQALPGTRAGGLHSRTIEVLDQRGIADRFLSQGTEAQVAGFAWIRLDISDFPTRHPYGLGLWQNHIERILAEWVDELAVPIHRSREVTGFAQDDAGVTSSCPRAGRCRRSTSSGATGDAA